METKVLTQDEITQLKNIQQERFNLIDKFGVIEIQFQELESHKKQLVLEYQTLKQTEEQIANQLQAKYGDGVINIEKGEFTTS
jgi:hypothetical protein